MTYNLNATTFNEFALFPNIVTGGIFWSLILMAFWVVVFTIIMRSNYGSIRSFAGSSFLTLIIAIILWALTFISAFTLIIAIVLAVLSLISLIVVANRDQ